MLKNWLSIINDSLREITHGKEKPFEFNFELYFKVKLLYPDALAPKRANPTDAGLDIFSYENCALNPNEIRLVKTGFSISTPTGYEAQIRSRSGLCLKKGIIVLNAPGTIDSSYRGEVGVILMNVSKNGYFISKGDRIAQMVLNKVFLDNPTIVKELDKTNRDNNGFGSTGK